MYGKIKEHLQKELEEIILFILRCIGIIITTAKCYDSLFFERRENRNRPAYY